ncbi:hypothetical protein A7X67_06090 [Clostridium sp. W14A]|nr:hypothetical protein A7X67_06090 [Clostridium sp. W14A]
MRQSAAGEEQYEISEDRIGGNSRNPEGRSPGSFFARGLFKAGGFLPAEVRTKPLSPNMIAAVMIPNFRRKNTRDKQCQKSV